MGKFGHTIRCTNTGRFGLKGSKPTPLASTHIPGQPQVQLEPITALNCEDVDEGDFPLLGINELNPDRPAWPNTDKLVVSSQPASNTA